MSPLKSFNCQVLTALGKASAICADVFAQEASIHVHLQKYYPSSRFQLRRTLSELELAGYDDRGMDVIGGKRAPLQKLYDTHKAWLLGYDIDTMNQTFSSPL